MTDNRKSFVKGFLAGALTVLLLLGAVGAVLVARAAREAGAQRELAEQAYREASAQRQKFDELARQAEERAKGIQRRADDADRRTGPEKEDK